MACILGVCLAVFDQLLENLGGFVKQLLGIGPCDHHGLFHLAAAAQFDYGVVQLQVIGPGQSGGGEQLFFLITAAKLIVFGEFGVDFKEKVCHLFFPQCHDFRLPGNDMSIFLDAEIGGECVQFFCRDNGRQPVIVDSRIALIHPVHEHEGDYAECGQTQQQKGRLHKQFCFDTQIFHL